MAKTQADRIGYWLLFLIWPMASLWASLKSSKWERIHSQIAVAFCVFLGFNLVIGGETGGSDSVRYAEELYEFHSIGLSFAELTTILYDAETGEIDVYQPLLTFFVAQFTSDPRYLFALFALVFGYLWIANFRLVVRHVNFKWTWLLGLVAVGYLLVNPIWNINGVRMWTAAHLFSYGIFLYSLEKKKHGILLSLLTPLIHWSFLLPIAFLVLFFLIRRLNVNVFLGLFIVSVFFAEINLDQVRAYQNYFPEVISERAGKYTNEASIEKRALASERSWHFELAVNIKKWFSIILPILIVLDKRMLKRFSHAWEELMKFGLLLGSLGYLASQIPSGGRFLTVAALFLFPVILYYTSLLRNFDHKWHSSLSIIISAPVLFWYIVMIRNGLGLIGFNVIIGNPISAWLSVDNTSFMSFVKEFL